MDKSLELKELRVSSYFYLDADLTLCVVHDEFPLISGLKEGNYEKRLTDGCYLITMAQYEKDPSIYGRAVHPFPIENRRAKEYYRYLNPTRVTQRNDNGEENDYYLGKEEDLISIMGKGIYYQRVFVHKIIYSTS